MTQLNLEDTRQNTITCFPLGGQHYCAANAIARVVKPTWPTLKSFLMFIILSDAVEVGSTGECHVLDIVHSYNIIEHCSDVICVFL